MKNHRFFNVFRYFRIFIKIAENPLKVLPKSFQEASKTPQTPPRSSQDAPIWPQETSKTPPRRPPRCLHDTQSTPKTRPRRAKTAQDTLKMSLRSLQNSIFEGLETKNCNFRLFSCQIPAHLVLQASKHLSVQQSKHLSV